MKDSSSYEKIGVVGAGAWGTALALTAARAGRQTLLWAREADVVESINAGRGNQRFLPDVALPENLKACGNLADLAGVDALLVVTPAQFLRPTLAALAPQVRDIPLVICAKGIETATGRLTTEILQETAPDFIPALLSGPSFAGDTARGLPTAVTIASAPGVAEKLQESLSHATFRPYASHDVTGAALGGAAKNVYAIGCGIVDGMKLGESARAALLARSFAELSRLGEKLGAKPDTLMGLSGLGDLVLTAMSPHSRNYSFGIGIGAGHSVAELTGPGQPLAEGVPTAPALVVRAKAEGIELPVAQTIAGILSGDLALKDAVPLLMQRPLRSE